MIQRETFRRVFPDEKIPAIEKPMGMDAQAAYDLLRDSDRFEFEIPVLLREKWNFYLLPKEVFYWFFPGLVLALLYDEERAGDVLYGYLDLFYPYPDTHTFWRLSQTLVAAPPEEIVLLARSCKEISVRMSKHGIIGMEKYLIEYWNRTIRRYRLHIIN